MTEKKDDSLPKVNYPQDILSGVRKTVGFKCDTGLYSAFKEVAQAKFGSVCRPLECIMLTFLALNKERVNFGTTVRIDHLHVERNLRPRRNLEADTCGFARCNKFAVGTGVYIKTGRKFFMCEGHFAEAKANPSLWSEVARLEDGDPSNMKSPDGKE